MLESAVALRWSAGAADISLGAEFVWATALLAGIAAMARNHIRGFTRCPRAVALTKTARELRLLLFYTGFAWGLGAFLILPPAPLWAALVFAAAPSLIAALALECEKSAIAFIAPASFLSALAVFWGQQAAWAGWATLMAGVSIAGFSMLRCAMRASQDLH